MVSICENEYNSNCKLANRKWWLVGQRGHRQNCGNVFANLKGGICTWLPRHRRLPRRFRHRKTFGFSAPELVALNLFLVVGPETNILIVITKMFAKDRAAAAVFSGFRNGEP